MRDGGRDREKERKEGRTLMCVYVHVTNKCTIGLFKTRQSILTH